MAANQNPPGCGGCLGGPLGCLGAIFVAIAAFGVMWAYDAFIDAPWAHSIGGRATLTGHWVGNVTAHTSPGGMVWLEIIRGSGEKRGGVPQQYDNSRLTGRPLLRGTATWCRADGTTRQYTIRGSAFHSGDSVTMTFTAVTKPTQTGDDLNETHGHWSGTGLVVRGPLQRVVVVPGRPSGSYQMEQVPDTLTLRPVRSASDTVCSTPKRP